MIKIVNEKDDFTADTTEVERNASDYNEQLNTHKLDTLK